MTEQHGSGPIDELLGARGSTTSPRRCLLTGPRAFEMSALIMSNGIHGNSPRPACVANRTADTQIRRPVSRARETISVDKLRLLLNL